MSPALKEGDSPSLPLSFDIAVEDEGWTDVLDEPDSICARAIEAALASLTDPKLGELSIALIDDAAMQALNRDHRGKDAPTNVLSFPSIGPAPMLGDVVIARETMLREATERGIEFTDHFTHLLIHSFMHLQGYDHEAEAEAAAMEALEITALARLGIDNPYQIKEPSPS